MKSKLLIMGVLCAVAFTVNAQTEKGKTILSGSIGYKSSDYKSESINNSSSSTDGNNFKTLTIMPRYGQFVTKNLAVGLGLGYTNTKMLSNNISFSNNLISYATQTTKQHSYNFGPFLRYYLDVADKFKFFGQLNTSYGFGKSDQTTNYTYNGQVVNNFSAVSYKFNTIDVSINPGFAFFPTNKWSIDFSFPLLSYFKSTPKDQSPANINIYSEENFTFATSSFNPNIGFNFHF